MGYCIYLLNPRIPVHGFLHLDKQFIDYIVHNGELGGIYLNGVEIYVRVIYSKFIGPNGELDKKIVDCMLQSDTIRSIGLPPGTLFSSNSNACNISLVS